MYVPYTKQYAQYMLWKFGTEIRKIFAMIPSALINTIFCVLSDFFSFGCYVFALILNLDF